MLKIKIPSVEAYDEKNNLFINIPETDLQLEHSLVSISKWESKWCKPFLTKDPKTNEELIDYIKCMTLTQNVNPDVYRFMPNNILEKINKYIEAPMTATTFREEKNKQSREIITSEIIYYWMVSFNIPFECQKWHLNRLLTLIRVCSVKNAPQKKMSAREIMARNKALNKSRKANLHTRG